MLGLEAPATVRTQLPITLANHSSKRKKPTMIRQFSRNGLTLGFVPLLTATMIVILTPALIQFSTMFEKQ